jgi:hypothetical protein
MVCIFGEKGSICSKVWSRPLAMLENGKQKRDDVVEVFSSFQDL